MLGEPKRPRPRGSTGLPDSEWPFDGARLVELLDNAFGMVWIKDREGRILFANRYCAEALGRPREELIGKTARDLYPAADAERFMRADLETLADGRRREFEESAQTAHGRRDYWVVKFPLLGEDGRPCAVAALCTDVTDRKAAEARLELQGTALEAAGNAAVITDRELRILWVNRAFTALTGHTLDEAVGHHPRDLLRHEPDQPERVDELFRTLAAGLPWRGEMISRRKDGSRFEEDLSVTPILDERGEVRNFVAVKQDISDRKRAEREIGRFVAGSPAVIYAVRPTADGLLPIWVSDNVTELTGFTRQEVLQAGWWRSRLHDEDAARVLANQVPNRAGPDEDHVILEYRLKRANGEYRWIRDEQRLTRDAAGAPLEIIGSWSDVTERVGLEEQYRQSQKLEAIGRLAGGVAHDFNNLLTVISGSAELLAATMPADGAGGPLLGEIRDAADRAASLTRQLLAFSRSQVLAPRVLRLNEAVERIESLLRRLIGEDIALETRLDPAVGHVLIDPGQLEQVIVNLAVNARDAMPRGGRLALSTRELELDAESARRFADGRPGRYAVLSIADTGLGMTPQIRARIFEPFFTTKEQGSGLGLATVFGIVRQSEGQIEVESAPGAGTRFDVFLPLVTPALSGDAAEPRPAATSPRGSETILLVEDEEALRKLARLALERLGFRVLAAGDGREALAVVERAGETIDLLVSDLVMPVMSGRELAGLLRRRRPDLRVLFMSGYVADSELREDVAEGGDDFLQKPFRLAELASRVREILDRGAPGPAGT